MKLFISVLACFCVLHVNGQFSFSRFLSSICRSSQNRNNPACKNHTPPPPLTTATTNTITTRPTTRFLPPTTTRRPPSTRTPCVQRGQCSNGVFLADAFATTLLSGSSTNIWAATAPPPERGRVNNNSSGARAKRQIPQPVQKKDLAILMDESGSVGENGFDKVKRIAAAMIRILCSDVRVHPDRTLVALTSFDSQVHHHRNLLSARNFLHNYDGNAIADWIDGNILYSSATDGGTCLIDALNFVADTVLAGGRRGEPNVEQDVILITDGCENCRSNPLEEIKKISKKFVKMNINVQIIGIGIGGTCEDMLDLLSQQKKCFETFYLQSDTEANEFLRALEDPPPDLCYSSFQLHNRQCQKKK